MASLTQEYEREKLLGQIYTPHFIVEKILNDTSFNSPNIVGKSVLDPACGDGRFLCRIAEKIVEYSPTHELASNLQQIHGWDIDPTAIAACIANLNKVIENKNITIEWNVKVFDSLKQSELSPKFDFIVGNPPYIRIQHLDIEQRTFIQQHYVCCQSGSTDIYIAFFELCFKLLKTSGICGLIAPNTWLFTETAKPLRQLFYRNKNILQISNFGDLQVFDNATTYSAITIFGKTQRDEFLFEKALTLHTLESRMIHFAELTEDDIWRLSLSNKPITGDKLLKDICNIHVGITTLMDKAYIFDIEQTNDNAIVIAKTLLMGNVPIERNILKTIIKASTLKKNMPIPYRYILFPYKLHDGKVEVISENEMQTNYPLTYTYLASIKTELAKRDNGKPVKPVWYAFGRSQGLTTSFGAKILFSPMNKKPQFIFVDDAESTFYSGYCIKYSGDYQTLLTELNSERMAEFIAVSSRDFRGGWKAYSKRSIENFPVV